MTTHHSHQPHVHPGPGSVTEVVVKLAVDEGVDAVAGDLQHVQRVVHANRDHVRKAVQVEDDCEEENVDGKFADEEGDDDDVNQLDGSFADPCSFLVLSRRVLEERVLCVPLDGVDDEGRKNGDDEERNDHLEGARDEEVHFPLFFRTLVSTHVNVIFLEQFDAVRNETVQSEDTTQHPNAKVDGYHCGASQLPSEFEDDDEEAICGDGDDDEGGHGNTRRRQRRDDLTTHMSEG